MGNPSNRERAEKFISQIKGLLDAENSLIYGVDSSIDKPNVISPSTVGQYDARINVTLYNVSNADDAFSTRKWRRIMEIGAKVDTYSGSRHNNYNPVIEFYKRF